MPRTQNSGQAPARVQNDPTFAQALLGGAITLLINGEPESAEAR
jgi:hypothetical protein